MERLWRHNVFSNLKISTARFWRASKILIKLIIDNIDSVVFHVSERMKTIKKPTVLATDLKKYT